MYSAGQSLILLWVKFSRKRSIAKANSVNPDQRAPSGAVQ